MMINYVLIITIYMFGAFDSKPKAVTQTAISGFTSEQACKNAGIVAKAGAPNIADSNPIITYQCSPLSL